ncbi:MAG: NosD domain-containing protein [Thermoplasmata archaeon]
MQKGQTCVGIKHVLQIALILLLLTLHSAPSHVEGEVTLETLRINGNAELMEFADVHELKGDGTAGSPFVIEGYTFRSDTLGNQVFIGNTSLHFVVSDCTFIGGSRKDIPWNRGAGLELHNVKNATVDSNTFQSNRFGILLTGSSNNELLHNVFENNSYGISLNDSPNNTARENVFDKAGFHFEGSRDTYVHQQIFGNRMKGEHIFYINNVDMDWGLISPNANQVIIANVSRVNVRDIDMQGANMLVAFSSEVEIDNVKVITNSEEGILIYRSSQVNIKNSIADQNKVGIKLMYSSFNGLHDNLVRGNTQDGIYLDHGSDYNIIDNNTLSTNSMVLHNSEQNVVTNNMIFRSIGRGVRLLQGSYHNRIYNNALLYNNLAMDVFNASRIQARDVTGKNHWNSSEKRGNYWRDWTGPDEDEDGVVDDPYNISGGVSKDWYPLAEPPMPVIPSPPRNLTISPGNSTLRLSWESPSKDGGSEIHAYRIYRGALAESQRLLEDIGVDKTSYNDTGLVNEVSYFYRVSAVNSIGASVSTSIVKGIPDGIPPELYINEPQDDLYTNDRSITATWNGTDDNSGIDFFEIRLGNDPWINVGYNKSHTFYNLTDGTRSLWVKAVDKAGNQATCRVVFTIDTKRPSVISYDPVGPSKPVNASVRVMFSEEMDQDTVEVVVNDEHFMTYEWLNETTLRAFPPDVFIYGTNYHVNVIGSDLAGNELTTTSWSFETKTGGTVTGRIINKDGNSVSGVKISLEDTIAFTDEQGQFRFATYSGERTAVLTKEGYEGKEVTIEVVAGEETDVGEITMSQIKASSYDLLLIIASFVVVVTGIMALAIFLYHYKDMESMDEEIEFEEEDTEELPPEFLE